MHTESVVMTDNTIPLSSLILRVVYSQFCKARLACTQKESDYLHVTFDLGTSVQVASDTSME